MRKEKKTAEKTAEKLCNLFLLDDFAESESSLQVIKTLSLDPEALEASRTRVDPVQRFELFLWGIVGSLLRCRGSSLRLVVQGREEVRSRHIGRTL